MTGRAQIVNPVNPQPRSKLMVGALVLTSLAIIAVLAAYIGEWWMTRIQYPNDFPNDPESDRGFRILKLYWLTFGAQCLFVGALFWALGLFLYLFAGLTRRASWLSEPGQWCAIFHLILGGYVVFAVLAKMLV